jgi:hypothetical protein
MVMRALSSTSSADVENEAEDSDAFDSMEARTRGFGGRGVLASEMRREEVSMESLNMGKEEVGVGYTLDAFDIGVNRLKEETPRVGVWKLAGENVVSLVTSTAERAKGAVSTRARSGGSPPCGALSIAMAATD